MSADLTSARYELLTKARKYTAETHQTLLRQLDEAIGYPAPAELYLNTSDIPANASPIAPLPSLAGKEEQDLTIGLCLGHARPGDMGARALDGTYEEPYNEALIRDLALRLTAQGYKVKTYLSYTGSSYASAMEWIAKKLKADGVDLAIEFHFNSASESANGFEMLHWHRSSKGVLAAKALQAEFADDYPEHANRGTEPLGDEAHERGVLFTSLTHCPAVIAEPFFGSNAKECDYFIESGRPYRALVDTYDSGIRSALSALVAAS